MSYCVNCGVKLAPSERQCPLCDVVVVNPENPWQEPTSRPYPERVERVVNRVDRKYIVWLASLFLFIPIAIPPITDWLLNRTITWSGYVIGAGVCVFVWILLPFLFQKRHPYLIWFFDFLTAAGYLALIAWLSGDFSWYIPLGFSLVAAISTTALLTIAVFSTVWNTLNKAAACFMIGGFLVVLIDFVIHGYLGTEDPFHWSFFVAMPCLIFAIASLILNRRQRLKDQIHRRLFY